MRNKELFRGRRKAGRLVGLVLTLALAVSLLSGCGQSKERLTFGTGGTAGTYYSYGGVLAQYITNNTNVKVTAVSTGGSKANLQSVQDGDFQLGFVQSDVMAYAWEGVPMISGLWAACMQRLSSCLPWILTLRQWKI